ASDGRSTRDISGVLLTSASPALTTPGRVAGRLPMDDSPCRIAHACVESYNQCVPARTTYASGRFSMRRWAFMRVKSSPRGSQSPRLLVGMPLTHGLKRYQVTG